MIQDTQHSIYNASALQISLSFMSYVSQMSVAPEQYIGHFLRNHVCDVRNTPENRVVNIGTQRGGQHGLLLLIFQIQKHTKSTQTQQCSMLERREGFLAETTDQSGVMAVT